MDNSYEMMLIVRLTLSETDEKKMMVRMEKMLAGSGKIVKTENLGKKQLAYRIKKEVEGNYRLLNLELKPASVSEITAKMKMEEEILRFLILRKKKKIKTIKKEKGVMKEKVNEVETTVKKVPRKNAGPRKSGKKARSK